MNREEIKEIENLLDTVAIATEKAIMRFEEKHDMDAPATNRDLLKVIKLVGKQQDTITVLMRIVIQL